MSIQTLPGQMILCSSCMAYLGPLVDNQTHRHHAHQIVLAIDTPFLLTDYAGTRYARCASLAPDTPHEINSRGAPVLVLLAEAGKAGNLLNDNFTLPPDASALLASPDFCPRRLYMGLCHDDDPESSPVSAPDDRIERVKALARRHDGKLTLTRAAQHVGLSPSRLTHLFRAGEGISFKQWLLWERMLHCADFLATGADLTTAAHAADFADSAHFSRSFRALFGLTAADIFRSRSVQVRRCTNH